jgi:hypothetical protein
VRPTYTVESLIQRWMRLIFCGCIDALLLLILLRRNRDTLRGITQLNSILSLRVSQNNLDEFQVVVLVFVLVVVDTQHDKTPSIAA